MVTKALTEDPLAAGQMLGGAAADAMHLQNPLLRGLLEQSIGTALTFARGWVPTDQLLPKAQEAVDTFTALTGKPHVDIAQAVCSAGRQVGRAIAKRRARR